MRRLLRFAGLARADRKLILHAAATLVVSQARLRIQNAERLRAWASCKRSGAAPVDRLIWAIERASQIVPGATCLARAVALQRLLSINGHDSLLAIGVGRPKGDFIAHAWVAQGERILIGEGGETANYKVIACWCVGSQPPPKRRTA